MIELRSHVRIYGKSLLAILELEDTKRKNTYIFFVITIFFFTLLILLLPLEHNPTIISSIYLR